MSRTLLVIGIGILVFVTAWAAGLFLAPRPELEVFTPGISLTLADIVLPFARR